MAFPGLRDRETAESFTYNGAGTWADGGVFFCHLCIVETYPLS